MIQSTELADGLDRDMRAEGKAAEYGARHHTLAKCAAGGRAHGGNFTAISMPCAAPRAETNRMQLAKGEFGGRFGVWR